MIVTDTFADSWTLDDYLKALQFQISAYQLCKQRDHSSLIAFNLAAIEIECGRIGEIIKELKRDGGLINE